MKMIDWSHALHDTVIGLIKVLLIQVCIVSSQRIDANCIHAEGRISHVQLHRCTRFGEFDQPSYKLVHLLPNVRFEVGNSALGIVLIKGGRRAL